MYKSVTSECSVKLNIKRSIFIATLNGIENEKSAKGFIKTLQKKYFNATHNCPAYIIKNSPENIEFYSDAGEPSGTAGRPIIGEIKKNELVNVVLVVTRFFGGVKLGIRGLINAYSLAARTVIEKAEIITFDTAPCYKIKIPYENYGKVLQEIHYRGFTIIGESFKNAYSFVEITGGSSVENLGEVVEKRTITIKR
jgi:uncharacterized YigZ family protein